MFRALDNNNLRVHSRRLSGIKVFCTFSNKEQQSNQDVGFNLVNVRYCLGSGFAKAPYMFT